MKILLREWRDKHYVWKPAVWISGSYYTVDTNNRPECGVEQIDILAVSEDDRANYVRCEHCGQLVENTPEAIERHFAEKEAEKDCLKCKHLRLYGNKRNASIKYVQNADGTYSITDTYVSKLGCKISYYTEEINSASAKKNCIFARCRRAGVKPIKDVFVQYPNPFDKQITIDFLDKKKFACEGKKGGCFEYDLKLRGTLKACVNECGIVDHFKVYCRGWHYNLYYSDRYNKLFFADYGAYKECITDIMSEAKANQIIAKISKLYEEADTNE